MKKTCEKCKTEFEAQADWQKLCLTCFKADKKTLPDSNGMPSFKDSRILRQVLLKIASEQVKGTPEQLVEYAKGLEKAWQQWT